MCIINHHINKWGDAIALSHNKFQLINLEEKRNKESSLDKHNNNCCRQDVLMDAQIIAHKFEEE